MKTRKIFSIIKTKKTRNARLLAEIKHFQNNMLIILLNDQPVTKLILFSIDLQVELT